MRTDELDYELPPGLIAQHPASPRDSARLLVSDRGAPIRHRTFSDLPNELWDEDLVVINDTRVLPARVRARRATGGSAEVLLLEPAGDGCWQALVRPYRRLRDGERLSAGALEIEIVEHLGEGRAVVRPAAEESLEEALRAAGEMPLPPYITEPLADPDEYQTVYARDPGSSAAPTAGLHFTPELLERLRRIARGRVGHAGRRARHVPAGGRGRPRQPPRSTPRAIGSIRRPPSRSAERWTPAAAWSPSARPRCVCWRRCSASMRGRWRDAPG